MFPPRVALILLLVELALLSSASFSLFRRWGNTHAEAGAYALLLPLMALSFGFEVAFLMGVPLIIWAWELMLSIFAIFLLIRNGKSFKSVWHNLVAAAKHHPAAALAFFLANLFFLVQIFSAEPEQLERLMLSGPGSFGALGDEVALFPSNVDVLALWLIRFHDGIAHSAPALMAFGTITFATYALARRYAWPPTAVTVTLMVISMPRLVCLVSAGSGEIIHAAAALLALLIIYRLVERPNGRDLFFLLMVIAFAVSMARLQWLYPLIMLPLGFIITLRRHGTLFFKAILIRRNLIPALMTAVPTVLFVVYPLLTRSAFNAGQTSNTWGLVFNPDGIQGALANSLRYLMEAIHLTLPVDQLFQRLFQSGPVEMLNWMYDTFLLPLVGNIGAIAPFQIHWAPNANEAWFGPFGFLAVIPALLYALLRGPRRLKAVAISLVGYFYLMCLIPAWQPGNAAFFTLLFTVGGFSAAFLLPPWRFSTRTKHLIQALSFILMFYSLLYNPYGLLAQRLPGSF